MAAPNSTVPSTSNSSADPHGILLNAGTNEVEILVFRIGEQHCGVNVITSASVFRRTTGSQMVAANYLGLTVR